MNDALIEKVRDVRWYHTLELPGGVVTPGEYDLRPLLERIPLPASLAGRRCLDVGTRDGFWAFEMEKRGAADVLGIDLLDHSRLDWPEPRRELPADVRNELGQRDSAFEVAREALGSKVERRELSIYDLKDSGERFDFAILGTLLLHLRDPVGALMSLRQVLDGELVLNEPISASLSVLRRNSPTAALLSIDGPFWWLPNVAALRRYLEMAGFEMVAQGRPYMLGYGASAPATRIGRVGGFSRSLLLQLGAPHVWLVARPRPGVARSGEHPVS